MIGAVRQNIPDPKSAAPNPPGGRGCLSPTTGRLRPAEPIVLALIRKGFSPTGRVPPEFVSKLLPCSAVPGMPFLPFANVCFRPVVMFISASGHILSQGGFLGPCVITWLKQFLCAYALHHRHHSLEGNLKFILIILSSKVEEIRSHLINFVVGLS